MFKINGKQNLSLLYYLTPLTINLFQIFDAIMIFKKEEAAKLKEKPDVKLDIEDGGKEE